jgi:hypothetical protein
VFCLVILALQIQIVTNCFSTGLFWPQVACTGMCNFCRAAEIAEIKEEIFAGLRDYAFSTA